MKLNQFLVYDELPLWSAPFGLTLLDTIRMKKGMNVLDIGSGGGFPMIELAGRLGSSCTVYGLDPSADAIAMINAKKEALGIINARIIKGVAEEIPFPDEYFNLIVANNGLNNVASQEAALAECYRVADTQAQMVITVNLPHTMTEFYEIFEESLRQLGLTGEITRMHEHIHEKRKPAEYLADLIQQSGFTIRSVNPDGFRLRYNDGKSFLSHHFIRQAFMPPWEAILPPERVNEIFELVSRKLDEVASRNGELVMSVPFACFDCEKS